MVKSDEAGQCEPLTKRLPLELDLLYCVTESARFADFRNPLDSHAFVLHFHPKDQIQIGFF